MGKADMGGEVYDKSDKREGQDLPSRSHPSRLSPPKSVLTGVTDEGNILKANKWGPVKNLPQRRTFQSL